MELGACLDSFILLDPKLTLLILDEQLTALFWGTSFVFDGFLILTYHIEVDGSSYRGPHIIVSSANVCATI